MSKVTSKLQVTLPKALATEYRIRPGDEILWVAAGDAIRVVPAACVEPSRTVASRLELFDQATERTRRRGARPRAPSRGAERAARGWTREELYERGRPR